jgi:hypothetical protein
VLRNAGLLTGTKQGRFVVYQLANDIFQLTEAAEFIDLGCCRLELPKK